MMKLRVARFNPLMDAASAIHEYEVQPSGKGTVLSALLYVYEEIDSTLAFRFGCSRKDCGLCAVEVNGKPRLACNTPMQDGDLVEPLRKLPIIRDLVVDRGWILPFYRSYDLFIPGQTEKSLQIVEPPQRKRLVACTECLGCLSTCPDIRQADPACGGPFHFVKLAQLHFDPRNTLDREAQARALGIARCDSCQKCYCVKGIPIVKDAILPLLGEKK